MVYVLSQSTLLRLQVAVQRNYVKWALGCVHFPGLAASIQVFRYSTKAQIQLCLHFVPFLGLSSSGNQVLGDQVCSVSYHLPGPIHLVSWVLR